MITQIPLDERHIVVSNDSNKNVHFLKNVNIFIVQKMFIFAGNEHFLNIFLVQKMFISIISAHFLNIFLVQKMFIFKDLTIF